MRSSVPSPRRRRRLWGLPIAICVVAAVYAAGVAGNGFWGYGGASPAQGATLCTTSAYGQETCVTKVCSVHADGVTITCATKTTVCSAPNTAGSRTCNSQSVYNTCTTDPSACQPTSGSSGLGDCSTSTTGMETCVDRACGPEATTTAGPSQMVCNTVTTVCTAPHGSPPVRTCTVTTTKTVCTTDPNSCVPSSNHLDTGGSGGGGSGGGGGGGAAPTTTPDQTAASADESGQPGPGSTAPAAGAPATGGGGPTVPSSTVRIAGVGGLVLGPRTTASPAGLRTGVITVGRVTCDTALVRRSCRFVLSGTVAGGTTEHRLKPKTHVLLPGARRRVAVVLGAADRVALGRGRRLRVQLTVAAASDGRQATPVHRTLVILPPRRG